MRHDQLELIARYLKGECSPEEQEQMEVWLEGNINRQQFEKIKQIWEATGEIYQHYSPDQTKAWKNIESGIARHQKARTNIHQLQTWVGRAAAILIAALCGIWMISSITQDSSFFTDRSMQEFSTDAEIDSLFLDDGTKVWLNKYTTIHFPEAFTEDVRQVRLAGEAFFEVARKPDKPFVIETSNTVTRVLGTTFNIKTDESQFSIAVLTGRVSFSENGNSSNEVVLSENEQAQYESATRSISTSLIDHQNFLAWKTGVLVFDNTSLVQVAETLSSHYHEEVQIDISNPDLFSLTTRFDNQNLREVIEVICLTLDLRYQKTSQGYIVKEKNQK